MRASDIVTLSLRQLKERRLRTVLTLLAVAVGVTSIIALSAQVEGVKEAITESLEKLGPDTVLVTARGRNQFTDADVARLWGLEGVSTVSPIFIMNVRVPALEDPVSLVGISSSELTNLLGEVKLVDGSVFYDAPAPQALIGYSVAIDQSGQARYKTGQPILIQIGQRSVVLTVVGVLDDYGSSPLIQSEDSIFIPKDYVRTLLRSSGYTIVLVKAEKPENVDQVVELITYVFGGRASVTSIKQITETVVSITSQVNLLLLGVAGTSFIAAGLGTFNIMMISVLERVREIGILKALGMKDRGVLVLYITQGLLLGVLGSLTGLGLGTLTAYALPFLLREGLGFGGRAPTGGFGQPTNIMMSYTPLIDPTYVVVATLLSVAVTLLSSAYPSWKASRLNPVDALRYE